MEQDPEARIAALEAELARVRAEAGAEAERFERRLKLAQSALPERRDPRTVIQNIAAQQEIEALRGALRERDRVVKELTAQVRSLEDQLEDQYRQMDAVHRSLRQRDAELTEARRQAELASRRSAGPAPLPRVQPVMAQQPSPPPSEERTDAVTFIVGLFVGVLLACAIAVGLWWTGNWPAAPQLTGGPGTAGLLAAWSPAAPGAAWTHGG
jgi:small-conductance mechanosensitive channel